MTLLCAMYSLPEVHGPRGSNLARWYGLPAIARKKGVVEIIGPKHAAFAEVIYIL